MTAINIVGKPKGAFAAALALADPGQEIVYHSGGTLEKCPHKADALSASNAGLVELFQRRAGQPGVFNYTARKRGQSEGKD